MNAVSKLLAAACVAAGAVTVTVMAPIDHLAAAPGKKEKDKDKDGPPKGGPKHAHDLKKTYDTLTEVTAVSRSAGRSFDRDYRPQLDGAKKLYRDAVKAADRDDPRAARELAVAAHDAARGLKHVLAANAPADPDLPKPPGPDGPADRGSARRPAQDELDRVKDRLDEVEDGGPIGRDFADAAKRAYTDAQKAFEDREYDRAAELARGAEAWTHVGEHLTRAAGAEPAPRPTGRRPAAPPAD